MKVDYSEWYAGQSEMIEKIRNKLPHLDYVSDWLDSRLEKSNNDARLNTRPDNYEATPMPPGVEAQRKILREFLSIYQKKIPYRDLERISFLHEVFSSLEQPPRQSISDVEHQPLKPIIDMGDPSNH
jgi:hypothetical protein